MKINAIQNNNNYNTNFQCKLIIKNYKKYLYRCVAARGESSEDVLRQQCNFLNSISEGNMISNKNKYTSTAGNINNALDYSTTFCQSYVLKIRVPKGTKV